MTGSGPGLAVLAPLTAAACYGVASVVQQVGARRAAAVPAGAAGSAESPAAHRAGGGDGSAEPCPTHVRLGPRLLVGLIRQPLFLLGLGLDAVGFVLAFVGLRHLPVFMVQAAVSSTVAVTAVLGRRYLADRLSRRDWILVGAVVLGLALVGASAAPAEHGPPSAWIGTALLLAGVPALAALALIIDRRPPPARDAGGAGARRAATPPAPDAGGAGSRRAATPPAPDAGARGAAAPSAPIAGARGAAALGGLSGVGFGGFAVAGRLMPGHAGTAALLADPVLWAAVLYAVVGLGLFGAALQRGSVTAVTAAAIATEALFPSAVGLLLLSDHTRPGLAGAAVAGFALTVGGAMALAGSRSDDPSPDSPLPGPPAQVLPS